MANHMNTCGIISFPFERNSSSTCLFDLILFFYLFTVYLRLNTRHTILKSDDTFIFFFRFIWTLRLKLQRNKLNAGCTLYGIRYNEHSVHATHGNKRSNMTSSTMRISHECSISIVILCTKQRRHWIKWIFPMPNWKLHTKTKW